jgi:hypothetical protein
LKRIGFECQPEAGKKKHANLTSVSLQPAFDLFDEVISARVVAEASVLLLDSKPALFKRETSCVCGVDFAGPVAENDVTVVCPNSEPFR